ncbi:tRNA (guanosine(46)-N7)-methyltransferase TrmB [Caulobacter sp. KR2-114]|uniref:tRNA (guanosine(46)-N7)-methyltransferase TrmB n=1 Tax=Caulobacter sp. KR2-114 TaxID=3400912 RepID=UPI003C09B02C
MSEDFRPLRTFGRIKSRPIKPRQAALMDTLLPAIRAPETPFDPRPLAAAGGQVWLEIGFGGGEHLAAQAERRPGDLFIGAEPFLNGVASALRHVDERGLRNVRLHPGDARELMGRLPDGSVDRIIILFPDPWPKARHHKRRLVQDDFLAEAARLLKPGGRLRFATDWEDYANWTLRKLLDQPAFGWLADRADDWRKPPADHVTTRYEEKRLGDCEPIWLEFERL